MLGGKGLGRRPNSRSVEQVELHKFKIGIFLFALNPAHGRFRLVFGPAGHDHFMAARREAFRDFKAKPRIGARNDAGF